MVHMGFTGGSDRKNLPAMQETLLPSLGQEDPLEKGMTHSSVLGWRIPWTEEPGGLQSTGLQRVRHDLVTKQQLVYMIIIRPHNSGRMLIWINNHSLY